MNYNFIPQVKNIEYSNQKLELDKMGRIYCSDFSQGKLIKDIFYEKTGIRLELEVIDRIRESNFIWLTGTRLSENKLLKLTGIEAELPDIEKTSGKLSSREVEGIKTEGYLISIRADGIIIKSISKRGLFYGLQTFRQILQQSTGKALTCLEIFDYPTLPYRGLMLDFSRGKLMKLDTLREIIGLMASYKYNVLQIYIEHTFAGGGFKEIGSEQNSLDKEFILKLKKICQDNYIELMPNLQSFGHHNKLLEMPEYRDLSESNLFWTLTPAKEETYNFLNSVYQEFLPLFDSRWFNVGADETYDLGKGLTKEWAEEEGQGKVYLEHILRLRKLAKKYDKDIMLFGDIVLDYPELLKEIPDDVIFLDWDYNPRDHYAHTSEFGSSQKDFWVCPGTGAWNSIFPRLGAAKKNIKNLIRDGLANDCQGSLLTDWGDHGHYAMVSASFYSYIFHAAVSWEGRNFQEAEFEKSLAVLYPVDSKFKPLIQPETLQANSSTSSKNFSAASKNLDPHPGKTAFCENEGDVSQPHSGQWLKIFRLFAEIYQLPGMWSKNRSQCVIALFEEPIFGATLIGPDYSRLNDGYQSLPPDIPYVKPEKGHHLLRPVFRIDEDLLKEIDRIIDEIGSHLETLPASMARREFSYLTSAFRCLSEKNKLGRKIRKTMKQNFPQYEEILDLKLAVEGLIKQYNDLMLEFISIWQQRSKTAEIHLTLGYFADIISRLKYLRDWLEKQLSRLDNNKQVDREFSSYDTCGYQSLPTY